MYNIKTFFIINVDFRFRKIAQRDERLMSSSVTSINGKMQRHPTKGAISFSVPMSSEIGILITQFLSPSFNHLIFLDI